MSFHLAPMYHNNWSPFGHFNNDLRMVRNLLHSDGTSRSGTPTVEPSYSYEANNKEACFEIEMPGVKKDDISIEVNGQKLVVKGCRYKKGSGGPAIEVEPEKENGTDKSQKSDGKKDDSVEVRESENKPSLIYLLEARLGVSADVDAISADNCGDGVLTVRVPMKTEKGSRKIQIGM